MLGASIVEQEIRTFGLVPVVEIDSAEQAELLLAALIDGGLPVAEITLRTSGAAAALERLINKYPEAVLGAGTVLNVDVARRMIDLGASFIVSPGTDEAMIEFCLDRDVLVIPGVCTPSEIQRALRAGAHLLKFFPAEAAGGPKYLKALAGPFREVHFVPTGGISPTNLQDYLGLSNVAACGGSWMVSPKLLAEGRFGEITDLVREALLLVARARRDH